jgi:hypothetical protein
LWRNAHRRAGRHTSQSDDDWYQRMAPSPPQGEAHHARGDQGQGQVRTDGELTLGQENLGHGQQQQPAHSNSVDGRLPAADWAEPRSVCHARIVGLI